MGRGLDLSGAAAGDGRAVTPAFVRETTGITGEMSYEAAFIVWAILGALIGFAAAQRRGYSTTAGAIGGLLLGPLAFLMFFTDGVASSQKPRKCPFCAELVKSEALVCKHCGRDIAVVEQG